MAESEYIIVDPAADIYFNNAVDFCIGTGRMGLAMQKEYQDQLKLVQEQIGFRHIRGHGLFCDDMAIYQEYTDAGGTIKPEYNFTYLDRVMDCYRELHIRPFLELGFMPLKLASGNQTVFYWKGNVTAPKKIEEWCLLVQKTLKHLMDRYGADEVVCWPLEVWNEPNLECFWENADMERYFNLFEATFRTVKQIDERFRVGGPAICGVDDVRWMKEFLSFCEKRGLKPDFITRHHYTTEIPEYSGHYGYARLTAQEDSRKVLEMTRDIIDSFECFKDLEIHITEFNTSYIPNCPLHDTNRNAAYIAEMLSWMGDMNASYSYWTFGDVFEEQGVPFTPFHGGFGLVADGCIRKPSFWAFCFFKKLQSPGARCVFRSDKAVIMRTADGNWRGAAWNSLSGRSEDEIAESFAFPADGAETEYCVLTETVDEDTCNPLKIWHSIGEPSSLSERQIELLRSCDSPFVKAERCMVSDGKAELKLRLKKNALVYFELTMLEPDSDRGYDYCRAEGGET